MKPFQFIELENKLPSSGLKRYQLKREDVLYLTVEIADTAETQEFLLKILKGLDLYEFAEGLL